MSWFDGQTEKKKKISLYITKLVPVDKQDQLQHTTCTSWFKCFVPNLDPLLFTLSLICYTLSVYLYPHLTVEIPLFVFNGQDELPICSLYTLGQTGSLLFLLLIYITQFTYQKKRRL